MRRLFTLLAGLSVLLCYPSQAHHSFAIYDIDNKIQRTGVLTEFTFSNPHIQLVLEVDGEVALSTITTDRGTTVIIEQVRQRRARENIPEETIKRN